MGRSRDVVEGASELMRKEGERNDGLMRPRISTTGVMAPGQECAPSTLLSAEALITVL